MSESIVNHLLSSKESLFLILFFGGSQVSLIIFIISYFCYKWRRVEMDGMLKLEMVKRGMSADEILRVLAAPNNGSSTAGSREDSRQAVAAHVG